MEALGDSGEKELLFNRKRPSAQIVCSYLLPLLSCEPEGVQVPVGMQLRLHGADTLLQGAQLTCDLPLQLLHLLQVLLQALGLCAGAEKGLCSVLVLSGRKCSRL